METCNGFHVSAAQRLRLDRAAAEPLKLVEFSFDCPNKCVFEVCGRTRQVYTVTLNRVGKFDCNCPDSMVHSSHNLMCKHVCFLLNKVFRYNFHRFIANGHCMVEGDEDYIHNIEKYEFDNSIVEVYKILKYGLLSFETPKKHIADAHNHMEDCPICLNPLDDKLDVIKSCPCCKSRVHKQCIDRWVTTNPTCIMCRSDVWQAYTQAPRNGCYIQLP